MLVSIDGGGREVRGNHQMKHARPGALRVTDTAGRPYANIISVRLAGLRVKRPGGAASFIYYSQQHGGYWKYA